MLSEIPALELMLHVVTARGTLNWKTWNEALASIANSRGLPPELSPSMAARVLDSLAHIELNASHPGIILASAPAALALLPRAGLPQAVLCGGRSPELERRLDDAAAYESARFRIAAPGPERLETPRSFIIEADKTDALAAVARRLGVPFFTTPPAWALANAVGSVSAYRASLDLRHEAEPNIPASEFDPVALRFRELQPSQTTLRLIQYFPRRLPPYYHLRQGETFARVDRDWGIHAALSDSGRNTIVHDKQAHTLAVPSCAPLPKLYSRSLTLCSGLPPAWLPAPEAEWGTGESRGYLVYPQVPSNIAQHILNNLGQAALPLHIPQQFLTKT